MFSQASKQVAGGIINCKQWAARKMEGNPHPSHPETFPKSWNIKNLFKIFVICNINAETNVSGVHLITKMQVNKQKVHDVGFCKGGSSSLVTLVYCCTQNNSKNQNIFVVPRITALAMRMWFLGVMRKTKRKKRDKNRSAYLLGPFLD